MKRVLIERGTIITSTIFYHASVYWRAILIWDFCPSVSISITLFDGQTQRLPKNQIAAAAAVDERMSSHSLLPFHSSDHRFVRFLPDIHESQKQTLPSLALHIPRWRQRHLCGGNRTNHGCPRIPAEPSG